MANRKKGETRARRFDPYEFATQADSTFFERSNIQSTYFLLNAISDGVIAVSSDFHVIYSNQASRNLLGFSQREMHGRSLASLLVDRKAWLVIESNLRRREILATDQNRIRHADGTEIAVIITGIPILEKGSFDGAIIVFRDVLPGVIGSLNLVDRERLLQGMFDMLPTGALLLNQGARILRINEMARSLLGLPEGELRGKALQSHNWRARNADGEWVAFEESPIAQAFAVPEYETQQELTFDGAARCVLVTTRALNSHLPGIHSGLVLVTFTPLEPPGPEAGRMDAAAELSQEINSLLTDLLTERGASGTIRTALAGVRRLTGSDLAALGIIDRGSNLVEFAYFDGDDAAKSESFRRPLSELNPGGPDGRGETVQAGMPDPRFSELGFRRSVAAPVFSEGEQVGLLYLLRRSQEHFAEPEVEEMRLLMPVLSAAIFKASYEARLNELATTDALTGLWNRRVFFERLELEMERSRRYKMHLSVLMLDLDHFKDINDRYGHLAGDEMLVEVARVMELKTRRSDLVARTGGEDFMVLLPEAELPGALRTAEKLRAGVEALSINIDGQPVRTTVSIGAAAYEPDETLKQFYARLDALLYRSKSEGRNRVSQELSDEGASSTSR